MPRPNVEARIIDASTCTWPSINTFKINLFAKFIDNTVCCAKPVIFFLESVCTNCNISCQVVAVAKWIRRLALSLDRHLVFKTMTVVDYM